MTKFLNLKKFQLIEKCFYIMLILRKGKKHEIENYRSITLNLALLKIFSKLIEQRIRLYQMQVLDENFQQCIFILLRQLN